MSAGGTLLTRRCGEREVKRRTAARQASEYNRHNFTIWTSMASTQHISSDRSLALQASAKAAVSTDSSALLDEFSRLVDNLVTHVNTAKNSATSLSSFSVEAAATQRVVVHEKPKAPAEAKRAPVEVLPVPQNETPETEAVEADSAEETATEDDAKPALDTPKDAGTGVEVAAEVSVAAAAQVTPIAPTIETQVAATVGASTDTQAEVAVDPDLLSETPAQTTTAATPVTTKVEAKVDATTGKIPVTEVAQAAASVAEEVTTTAPEAEVSTDNSLAEALSSKGVIAEGEADASASASTKSQRASAELNAPVTAGMPGLAEESVTGILLRHAFQAVSKALGMERGENRQLPQTPQVSGITSAKATAASDGDMRQAKLKALPRPVQVKLMERVEKTLQEMARAKDGKSVSLKLEPADLGQMRVDVSIRDGVLHARITPESKPVAAYLQEKAHELQSMLRKLGLNVDSVTVSVRSEEFTVPQGEQNSQGSGKNSLSSDGHNDLTGNNFPTSQGGFSSGGSEKGSKSLEDHWVA